MTHRDPFDPLVRPALEEEYEDCVVPTILRYDDPRTLPLHERPLIYVAAYYTANPAHGLNTAVEWAERLRERGWLPFVPHVSLLWDAIAPNTPDFWYEVDLGYLLRCDALFVCPGQLTEESKGVREEVAFAHRNSIPVLYEPVPAGERYDHL